MIPHETLEELFKELYPYIFKSDTILSKRVAEEKQKQFGMILSNLSDLCRDRNKDLWSVKTGSFWKKAVTKIFILEKKSAKMNVKWNKNI